MMIIYTVHKYGEVLSQDVLGGVLSNQCSLLPISSSADGQTKRKNMADNWNRCIDHFSSDVFLGMDSDAILPEGAIEEMLAELDDADIVIANYHSAWAVKKNVLSKVQIKYTSPTDCPICDWFCEAKKEGFVEKRIEIEGLNEMPRVVIHANRHRQ